MNAEESDHIGKKFLEKTRPDQLSQPDQQKNVPPPPRSWDLTPKKTYDLPAPEEIDLPEAHLLETIDSRRSKRSFTEKPLSNEDLSILLYYTQGIQRELSGEISLRTVPSAGARHAFETMIYLDKATSLPRGIYHYQAEDHSLGLILSGNFQKEAVRAGLGQNHLAEAAAVFFWVADSYRMEWRYSERAFRYLHLDAGHVCQNLYLAAEALDAGVCAIAAYDDDYANKLLNLDGQDNFVIYMAALGFRKN
ncbi:SagB/ThcOx family dehydrogenase [Halarsenatibacter silvermanii]|uniref:SagB-type dehydrogenase domain-containing protein n=1 Tax=Halarsenatibacter silvermanii TaxID=321763 RepID=A0A1G9I8A4_9FIRM|nr:SagB/ThcOx family dehydrogenase [Halarsenatibacter silvermanii]SDL21033.1 SagB-type dehydrogenase domain-containing protein [Halarsenatibacter silvermanii]